MSKIQLQVGKRYVRRDGRITGALAKHNDLFIDAHSPLAWFINGVYIVGVKSLCDIVSEYAEPQEGFDDLTEADHKAIDDYAAQGAESQSFDNQVDDVLDMVSDMLKKKNKAYGNSALDPIRVFSKADPVEQLNVRIDDKLSRIMRGTDSGEDTELDLIGYLVIRRIAKGGDK